MKKLLIVCSFFCLMSAVIPTLSAENVLSEAEELFLDVYSKNGFQEEAYAVLYNREPQRAQQLKMQAEAVERIFRDVLKTEKQLIPKQCNYIIIYGYHGSNSEDIKKACDNLRLALFANADRPSMQLFLTGSKENIAAFKEAALKTPVNPEKIIMVECITDADAAQAIVPLITADIDRSNYNMGNLLYRRILLLTKASNARIGYAAFTAALGSNTNGMLLDCFSTLDISRKSLDTPTEAERRAAFMELRRR